MQLHQWIILAYLWSCTIGMRIWGSWTRASGYWLWYWLFTISIDFLFEHLQCWFLQVLHHLLPQRPTKILYDASCFQLCYPLYSDVNHHPRYSVLCHQKQSLTLPWSCQLKPWEFICLNFSWSFICLLLKVEVSFILVNQISTLLLLLDIRM